MPSGAAQSVSRSGAVPPSLYDERLLSAFAGGEHEQFIADGGRVLRPRLARALELASIEPGMLVADVGCGRGEAAAHAGLAGARVAAIDFSPDALRMTRRTYLTVLGGHVEAGRLPQGQVMPIAASAERLPLRTRSVDRVLLLDIVEHLVPRQLEQLLGEAERILNRGGCVVVHTLPNKWALSLTYPMLRLVAPGLGLPASPRSGYERRVHVNEQSPRTLRAALREAGLDGLVWVEEMSTSQAARSSGLEFPDRLRRSGYRALRRPIVRWTARLAMRTPLRQAVGNDIFAVAWTAGGAAPPAVSEVLSHRRAGPHGVSVGHRTRHER